MVNVTLQDAKEMVALVGFSIAKVQGDYVVYPKGLRGAEKAEQSYVLPELEDAIQAAWSIASGNVLSHG